VIRTVVHKQKGQAALIFDSIPHAELIKSVTRRVSDKRVVHLIKMRLTAPTEETYDNGNTHRTTRNKDQGRGMPQGAPITPAAEQPLHASVCVGLENGYANLNHRTTSRLHPNSGVL